jgi:hypothetical protein
MENMKLLNEIKYYSDNNIEKISSVTEYHYSLQKRSCLKINKNIFLHDKANPRVRSHIG